MAGRHMLWPAGNKRKERIIRMTVMVMADCGHGKRRYWGAKIELPAGPYEIQDVFQRARVPEGGGYQVHSFEGWPGFLKERLAGSGAKTLEEINLLADAVSRMDEFQLGTYEGAIILREFQKKTQSLPTKDMISLAFALDGYDFYPGVNTYAELGEICLAGGMLDIIDSLPDEVLDMLGPVGVGRKVMQIDHGTFTPKGYVFPNGTVCQEIFDGESLPLYGDSHDGVFSLRIGKARSHDGGGGVWLELPAGAGDIRRALELIGEPSFASCGIAEIKGVIPQLRYGHVGCGDIEKLDTLAERLKAMPDSRTLMKYKAALELERCGDLNLALDIAVNLGCYDYNPDIVCPAVYGEHVLENAGIDIEDPAFSSFDFDGYGERSLEKDGLLLTPYGSISRNGQAFAHEYTEQAQEAEEPGRGMAMG